MSAIYLDLHAYLTFEEGPPKSTRDKLVLDHQERRSRFKFSGFQKRDPDFNDTGYLLISRYSKNHGQVIVDLFSIAKNEVLHTWIPPQREIFDQTRNLKANTRTRDTFRVQHPLLLANGDLIFVTGEGPLIRINACGEVVWIISRHFHHSIEVNHLGNLVTCIVLDKSGNGTVLPIRDDGIAIVSFSGKVIKEYSVTDILLENGYSGLVYGVGSFEKDRIHLNDAQPILRNTESAKIGDIALSIRNLSTVALFEPESGKLKWLKTGPWLNQHDINQLEDGRYSIFGNDIVRQTGKRPTLANAEKSDVYVFDQLADSVTRPYSAMMKREKIASAFAGRLKILGNGDAYIEESVYSRLIRISEDKVRWEYVNSITPDTVGAIHWSRYISEADIDLAWMGKLECN